MVMLRKTVGLYELYPLFYSPAWHDFATHHDVCYPTGIHWIVRWIRKVWIWTLRTKFRDIEMFRVREVGYKEGYEAGKSDGIAEGRRLVFYEIAEAMENEAKDNCDSQLPT